MGAAKPTLGYPSRTEAVLALRSKGYSADTIALMIGIGTGTVFALHSAGQRAQKRRQTERNAQTIVLPSNVLERLKPHADLRGINVNELARRIIDTVINDDLVTPILDDQE